MAAWRTATSPTTSAWARSGSSSEPRTATRSTTTATGLLRAVAVPSCEMFGAPVEPGCLATVLAGEVTASGRRRGRRRRGGGRTALMAGDELRPPLAAPGGSGGGGSGAAAGAPDRPGLDELDEGLNPTLDGTGSRTAGAGGQAPNAARSRTSSTSSCGHERPTEEKPGPHPCRSSATPAELAGHKIALGLPVAASGCSSPRSRWGSINGVPFQDRYELKAWSRRRADPRRVTRCGSRAGWPGFVTDVRAARGGREVQMELRPAVRAGRRDATRQRPGQVDRLPHLRRVSPGDLDDPMPEGGTIPVEQTGSGVDLLEVVELFDQKSRERRCSAPSTTSVPALPGAASKLNAAIARPRRDPEDGTAHLEALTPRAGAIAESSRARAGSPAGSRANVRRRRGDPRVGQRRRWGRSPPSHGARPDDRPAAPVRGRVPRNGAGRRPAARRRAALSDDARPGGRGGRGGAARAEPDARARRRAGFQTARAHRHPDPCVSRKATPVLAASSRRWPRSTRCVNRCRVIDTLETYDEDVKLSALEGLSATGAAIPREAPRAGSRAALRPRLHLPPAPQPLPEPGDRRQRPRAADEAAALRHPVQAPHPRRRVIVAPS